MGFTRMKYSPEEGLKRSDVFPDTPVSPEAAREQFQRLFDQVKVQVNQLCAALESTEMLKSGAENIGSAPVGQLSYNGVLAKTIWAQLAAMNEKLDVALQGELALSDVIVPGSIVANMLASGAVTADSVAAGAVGEAALQEKAVTTGKLGTVSALTLKQRSEVGMYEYDTLSYANGKLALKLADCEEAQLAPVRYGTSATPPAGTYPPGTLYVQYVE